MIQIWGRYRSHDFYRCKRYCPLKIKSVVLYLIIWLNPRAGKMKWILHVDWIPERARLARLVLSGSPACSRPHSLVLGQRRIFKCLFTSLLTSFLFLNFSCKCFPCSFEEFWTGLLNYSDGISEVAQLISPFCQLKEFISKKGYPQWTQVTRVVEGGETPIFKQFFSGWRDEGEQVGLGKVFRQGHLGEFIPLPYMFFIFTVDTVLSYQNKERKQTHEKSKNKN